MISRHDLQRLLRPSNAEKTVLSVFLDMSVTSDNKRTYPIFVNRQKAQHAELDSDRETHHREALGAAFERVERWLADGFEEANKGVALFAEIGGPWFDALQFPVPVANRLAIGVGPVIGPLAQLLDDARRHGIVLIHQELNLFTNLTIAENLFLGNEIANREKEKASLAEKTVVMCLSGRGDKDMDQVRSGGR